MNYAQIVAMTKRPARCGLVVEVIAKGSSSERQLDDDEWQVTITDSGPARHRANFLVTADQTEQQVAWEMKEAACRLAEKIREEGNGRAHAIESAWTTSVLECEVSRFCVWCGTKHKVTKSTTAFLCANGSCQQTTVVR